RKDLPLSTYTEAYWKIDLHNLFHFLYLRMDSHAQYEIRRYAEAIGNEIVAKWCPIAWEAFLDYRVNSSHLTRLEMEVLLAVTQNDNAKAVELAKKFGWIKEDGSMKKNREREELEEKFGKMGIKLPWQ
ncbi:MAG TPA: FAD-dependent thymidylate synthase, partial [Ignavibacteria bacterium]|nr:FAD-dependent thymidylate synthase [Ignavibacteria bacterium]